MKDELILNQLDDNLRALKIEQSKFNEPWKLITKPTLLPTPVAPNRTLNIILGIISGVLFGSLIAIIHGKITGNIYLLSDVDRFGKKVLAEISDTTSEENYDDILKTLYEGILKDSKGTISLFNVSKEKNELLDKFLKKLNKFYKDINFKIENIFNEAIKNENLILVVFKGKTTKQELIRIHESISILGRDIKGSIVINNSFNFSSLIEFKSQKIRFDNTIKKFYEWFSNKFK